MRGVCVVGSLNVDADDVSDSVRKKKIHLLGCKEEKEFTLCRLCYTDPRLGTSWNQRASLILLLHLLDLNTFSQ